MLAGTQGPFNAVLTKDGAEAWLGRSRRRMTWPADWSVRFDPLELISPDGEVFAVEGQMLSAGGGYGSNDVWLVQSVFRDDPFIERLARLQERRDRDEKSRKS